MATIEEARNAVEKMVIGRPGFISIGIGQDSLGREAVTVTIERGNRIKYIDLPNSIDGHRISIVNSDKVRALKRGGKVDWGSVFR
jgi:hypothetical protein